MTGPGGRAGRPATVLIGLALLCVACGTDPVPQARSDPPPTASVLASADPPNATPRVGDPPVASLAVDGGDPAVGQLGTYTWAGGGSSSPWLPGTPIAVGAEETLTMTVDPRVAITDWTARIAPAGAADGAGVAVLASGTGLPVLGAPNGGSWTLAVTVDFGPLGSATYAWRLDVS